MLGWSCSFTALCLLRSQAESSPGAAGGDAGVVAWPQLPQQSSGSKANRTGSEAAITGERTSVYCGFFGCFSFRVSLCLGPWFWVSERIWSKRAQPWLMSDFSF